MALTHAFRQVKGLHKALYNKPLKIAIHFRKKIKKLQNFMKILLTLWCKYDKMDVSPYMLFVITFVGCKENTSDKARSGPVFLIYRRRPLPNNGGILS